MLLLFFLISRRGRKFNYPFDERFVSRYEEISRWDTWDKKSDDFMEKCKRKFFRARPERFSDFSFHAVQTKLPVLNESFMLPPFPFACPVERRRLNRYWTNLELCTLTRRGNEPFSFPRNSKPLSPPSRNLRRLLNKFPYVFLISFESKKRRSKYPFEIRGGIRIESL